MIRFLAFNYALRMQRCMILMDKFFFPHKLYKHIHLYVYMYTLAMQQVARRKG